MKIDISDLKQQQGESVAFAGEEGFKSLDFMGEEICFVQPLQVEGTVTNTEVGFLVHGTASTVLSRQCGRCTEPFSDPLEVRFDMIYRQTESAHHAGSKQPTEEETDPEDDVEYFKGNTIDLKDLILESVVMAIPMRAICTEDCRGLCPVCGQNLNEKTCTCAEENVDVRLAGLKELLNKD
jgi:uncharacterized protein